MKVLIVGAGGREHTMAWKVRQSQHLERLWIAPGNAGTAFLGENIHVVAEGDDGVTKLVDFAREQKIDLVLVGPEQPLADGLSDSLIEAGIPVFGPSRAAAQLEVSKVFAKEFMEKHGIPTAAYRKFTDYSDALAYLEKSSIPVVVKASGLAGGKGVIVAQNLDEARQALKSMLVEGLFGLAGQEVILEEFLTGEEISVLAFCDGDHYSLMPPAQDHKRLLDGDLGPNTGGMGAYAPAPACTPALLDQIARMVFTPVLAGMAGEGYPYHGVLYAGMMLTPDGPKVLEFNCRFGDPETQVILPLLGSDLLQIAHACIQGTLNQLKIAWHNSAAVCVVLAAEGYPGKVKIGVPIELQDADPSTGLIFHAGTTFDNGKVVASGGRVLGLTGLGGDLPGAIQAAYQLLDRVSFPGGQYRRDIGWRALKWLESSSSAYASAGVDIDRGNQAVELMADAVRSTYSPQVLSEIGAFGGLFHASLIKEMRDPVLVASTDGVGTKVKIASLAGQYDTVGMDIVNHCINDILVQGAKPLFFLDYIASSKLDPEQVASLVGGMAQACREAGCALLGGETAEMPGVYAPGEFDIAGTIVGLVERDQILPRQDVQVGDLVLGWESSGAHTNGYSLIRSIFDGHSLHQVVPELGVSLGEALLATHRSYYQLLYPLLVDPEKPIKALAHITGGGFIENIPRVLPQDLGVRIRRKRWRIPPLFQLIQQMGKIAEDEMFRVFNMGIGMVAIVTEKDLASVQAHAGDGLHVIGEVIPGSGVHLT